MILLQIYFDVSDEKAMDFESMYQQVYVPALRKQKGYRASRLLRMYPPELSAEIEAAPSECNYQIVLVFDTEANRRKWAGSTDHAAAWPQAVALARSVTWRGYDITASDVA